MWICICRGRCSKLWLGVDVVGGCWHLQRSSFNVTDPVLKYGALKLMLNEYIALGGLVPNPTKVLIPILDQLFKKYILDEKGFPRVKVHGFACTSL